MIYTVISLMILLLQSSITFIGTYPTEFNDFVRTIVPLPDIGYQVIGSTDAPTEVGTRLIRTNLYGEVLEESTPPFSELCAVLANDTSIVQTYIYNNSLIIQKNTIQGSELWQETFPEYSHYFPKEVLACTDDGYLVLSAFQEEESPTQSVLKTDNSGFVEWETISQNSTPTGVTQNGYGSFFVTSLTDSGSKITVLNSVGEIQVELDLSDTILRDIIFSNELIVVAAVNNGVICLDESGETQWQYLPQDTIEVFSVSETFDNCIIASGSIMDNSERRALLVKLNQTGTEIWQNQFGYGSSFRSIFVKTCSDYGYCLVGGYVENGTLNSFVIKTDSEGNVNEQGFESAPGSIEQLQILEVTNPVFNGTVSILVKNFVQPQLSLVIRDVSGRTAHRQILSGNTGDIEVIVSGLHTGIYLVSAVTTNYTESLKFTVID